MHLAQILLWKVRTTAGFFALYTDADGRLWLESNEGTELSHQQEVDRTTLYRLRLALAIPLHEAVGEVAA
jgi:hypothetical protein